MKVEDQICIAEASWFGKINTGGVIGARVDKVKILRAWLPSELPAKL